MKVWESRLLQYLLVQLTLVLFYGFYTFLYKEAISFSGIGYSEELKTTYFPIAGMLLIGVICFFLFKICKVPSGVSKFLLIVVTVPSYFGLIWASEYFQDVYFAEMIHVENPANIDGDKYYRYYLIDDFQVKSDVIGNLTKEDQIASSILLRCYFPSPMIVAGEDSSSLQNIWFCPSISKRISSVYINKEDEIKDFYNNLESNKREFDNYRTNLFIREKNSEEYARFLIAIKNIKGIKVSNSLVLLTPYRSSYTSWKVEQEDKTSKFYSALGLISFILLVTFLYLMIAEEGK